MVAVFAQHSVHGNASLIGKSFDGGAIALGKQLRKGSWENDKSKGARCEVHEVSQFVEEIRFVRELTADVFYEAGS